MNDILIVGGGLIGLTLAREFHKKGVKKITILERGKIGRESSFAAAGMLAPQAEADKPDDFFRLCNKSNQLYPNFAAEIFEETGIDVELDQSGTLYVAFDEEDSKEILERYKWQKDLGLAVEHLTAQELHKIEPFISPDSIEGLFFPNDWQIENRKLLKALQKYAELNNIEIIEKTEVTGFDIKNGKIKTIETNANEEFSADAIILSTGAWTSLLQSKNLSLPKVTPIRGQMISFHTAKRLFTRVIYSPRGYIVPRKLGKILAGATIENVGFENETTDSGIETVKENALEISPSLVNLPIDEKWSGLRPFASDGLPIIGKFSEAENLFIATAHYRNGILLAPMTAKILVDKIINGVDSKYLEIYSPHRFNVAKAI